MTPSGILFGWIFPGLGLAFFVAGAVTNAQVMLGWAAWVREARERGGSPSMVPFVPGIVGAISLWNGPFEWMKAIAWLPLLLDAGCVPYLVMALFASRAPAVEDPVDAAAQAQALADLEQRAADKKARSDIHFQAFAGCLLGTAVGDALGLASEGLSPQRQARMFPRTDRYHFLPFGRGMCSDDTEHTVMVGQSIVETASYTRHHGDAMLFRNDLAWRMRWWLLGLPAGIGMATLKGILRLWLFLPPRWQGSFSAGNGPAMRSALIGVFWAQEPEAMRQHVEASTQLTHSDPKASQAALAVAVAAAMSAQQGGKVDANHYALHMRELLGTEGAELSALIDRVAQSVRAGETTQDFASALGLQRGVTGYAFHTVPVALHAWLAHPGSYREAVLAVIRCGGDTDTVAAITGGIAGAGCGRAALPPEWLSHLVEWPRNVAWMDALARQLAEMRVDFITTGLPQVSVFKLLLRNLFFLGVVLVHGFRRLLPPY
ncbi:MAG: ADP-ribosylglycohydrolase family protein [Ramlibacter sp.]